MTSEGFPVSSTLVITCESLNAWVDLSNGATPLASGEAWSIRMESVSVLQPNGTYFTQDFAFTMEKRKNGALIEGPYQVPASMTEDMRNNSFGLGFSLSGAPPDAQENGRFTIKRLPLPYSADPFVMYGWSTQPVTVPSAMFYICQVQTAPH